MGARPRWCVVAALIALVACDGTPRTGLAPSRTVSVSVVDEFGVPITDAHFSLVGQSRAIDVHGSADLVIDQPVAAVVRAPGFLDEPVAIDPSMGEARVRLFARVGRDGAERHSLHFGGDVMLGRRYQSTDPEAGTPRVDDSDGARALVADIAPLMAAADSSMVNLETVVGALAPLDAYPSKRFLIQSPAFVVDALLQMGVDFAALGNNHTYDWLEEGIQSTRTHLDAAGIAWAGAGVNAADAASGTMLEVGGLRVGVISTTTANGDFFNDSLPVADDQIPQDVAVGDRWQYQVRPFRFGSPGDAAYVAPASLLAGDAWQLFDSMEPDLDESAAAALWTEMRRVFPELQDAVARRGHGGATGFARFEVAREVERLRADGATFVVVQIHGGTQFSEVPSTSMRRVTHDAIDAGADLVIGHHPHVVQGFEFYRGKLIAYSLGNFVFDQDLLSTFRSMMLRVVVEGDRVLSTSIIPLVLNRYRPSPATGELAERVVRDVNASSLLAGSTVRLSPQLTGTVLDPSVARAAVVRRVGAAYELTDAPDPSANTFTVDPDMVLELAECSVIAVRETPPEEALVGLDLLGWGALDDGSADRQNDGGAQWVSNGDDHYEQRHGTYFHLESDAHSSATARPVARVEVPLHRWFDEDGTPQDGNPTYTLQLDLRRADDIPEVRVTLYDITDLPNEEPSSLELTKVELPLPRTALDEWRTATLDLSEVINASYDGHRAEAALISIIAPPGDNRVDIDEVRVYEWRRLAELPTGVWMPADALTSAAHVDVPLQVHGCSPAR